MERRGLAAVVGLAAAVVLVGCGSSNTPTSEASPSPSPSPSQQALITSVDACKLVTESDATAAMGTPMTNMATQGGATVPGACVYVNSQTSATLFVYAQTYPDTTAADSVQPDQIAALLSGQYGVSNAKAVSGIGDKAFEYTATSAGSSTGEAIFVFKANVVLMIVMSPSTDSTAIEKLARTAVGRL